MFANLRRLIGSLTLLFFVGGLLVPVLTASHLAGEDDVACSSDSLVVGHRTAQIDDSTRAPQPRHCDICHWLRAVASATVSVPTVADRGLVAGALVVRLASPVPHRLSIAGLTTRGPPAPRA